MGNPLYLSPLYNASGEINVNNNRFKAWHLGVSGQPTNDLYYRVLLTWQDGLGTYRKPYTHRKYNTSLMAEASYRLRGGWSVTGAFGADFGAIRGDNHGVQFTLRKTGIIR
jgi:hypothetical protein